MADEPLWLQSPPVEASPEVWLDAGDALFDLMPGSGPDLAGDWLQKRIGDIRARFGEFYTDF